MPDAVYEEIRSHFDEKQIADLTLAIAQINVWNRLMVAFRSDPRGAAAISVRPAQ